MSYMVCTSVLVLPSALTKLFVSMTVLPPFFAFLKTVRSSMTLTLRVS